MQLKILIVLTSHNNLGDTNKPTGFYLPEVTHPEAVFAAAEFAVDYVSPQGGKAPMVGIDLEDELNKAFINNPKQIAKVENTLTPSQINPKNYSAIFYSGGHGTMWDFPENQELANITANIYENGGVVGAVCHGSAGLVNVKLGSGEYLVAGKKISCFTNEEEAAVGLTAVVPFLLESKLAKLGANIEKAANFQPKVVVCDMPLALSSAYRIVTGQNPASATGVGTEIVKLLQIPGV
ncbi:MAG: type 1 glutamine amidotransferase domain-containing protein [Methylacidiphilales bacterium]|nr:type 1 glutamine amidotransferase domain-containing protein [Candidatus Methylacidiphilales bacterium]NJR19227.1 type 1 glutamine amidotransferase domain-containing protein [Calothrix sp. CSU_2_0]